MQLCSLSIYPFVIFIASYISSFHQGSFSSTWRTVTQWFLAHTMDFSILSRRVCGALVQCSCSILEVRAVWELWVREFGLNPSRSNCYASLEKSALFPQFSIGDGDIPTYSKGRIKWTYFLSCLVYCQYQHDCCCCFVLVFTANEKC